MKTLIIALTLLLPLPAYAQGFYNQFNNQQVQVYTYQPPPVIVVVPQRRMGSEFYERFNQYRDQN